MERTKSVVLIFCLALSFALAAPKNMLADEWNQATKLTFNEPVEVPGMVLAAGTYWFTLADNDSDRNIVQIWNADRTQLVTTVLAVSDYRQHTPDKAVINFEERPAGAPEAIHAWFYPGNNAGLEFVYPKSRASQLAKQTKRPVLSTPDEQPSDATQIMKAPVVAITPSGEQVGISEVVATKYVLPEEAPQSTLPQTGSDVPMLAVLGGLALTGSGVFRVLGRHIA